MPREKKAKSKEDKNGEGKNGEEVETSDNGMTWIGLAGLGLIVILALSVYLQPAEIKENGLEAELKTTTQKPRIVSEVRRTAAKTEESEAPVTAELEETKKEPEQPKKTVKDPEPPAKHPEPPAKHPEPPAKPPEPPKPKERKKKRGVQNFELEVPRVTLEELHRNEKLTTGHHAFVLTDIINKSWKAKDWTLDQLQSKIPFEWVDYYPENMVDMDNKPYLIKLEQAIPEFKTNTKAAYMQMRISLRGWKRIRKDFDPMPDHPTFWDDGTWIRECMKKDGKPDEKAIDNFFTTNQWKFLLIGQNRTTMFFHKDHTAASSWQAQVMGRKSWILCPNDQSHLLDAGMDVYDPRNLKHPRFSKALCGKVTVQPGEMVYYPGYMWHQALQHDTPTISYTGALVGNEAERDDIGMDRKVHVQFYRDLMLKCKKCWTTGKKQRHCDDISLQWPGAAPPPLRIVCDKYLPQCLKLWDQHSASLWQTASGGSEISEDTAELGEFD